MLVLRRETERPEAVTAGTVMLAGTDTENIYRLAAELLDDPAAYDGMPRPSTPMATDQACPAHRCSDPEPLPAGCAAARAICTRTLKKQHPAEDEQQLLVTALAVEEIQHQNQQQILRLEVCKRKLLQQLLQPPPVVPGGGFCFAAGGMLGRGRNSACGASGIRSTCPLLP